MLWCKVSQVRQALTWRQVLRQGTHRDANTIQIIRRTGTFSYLNRKLYKEALAREIKAPPSYHTRRQDGLILPAVDHIAKHMTS